MDLVNIFQNIVNISCNLQHDERFFTRRTVFEVVSTRKSTSLIFIGYREHTSLCYDV